MSYKVTRDYIRRGDARPVIKGKRRRFIVAHDTGNPGSTAYGNRNYFNRLQPSASAHTFIDDQYILEIIPLDEVAYHVRYDVSDANDTAIGVELCWGGNIDFEKAYKRYVWYMAYLCEKYDLDPKNDIIAHSELDPSRRSDPQNALNRYGVSWDDFIEDVENAFDGGKVEYEPETKPTQTSNDNLLRRGDRGPEVGKWQKKLKTLGHYAGNIDDIFGPKTERAVMRFQKSEGIKADGIIGPVTRKHLKNTEPSGASLKVDGKWGKATTTAIQKALGTTVDGIISSQPRNDVTEAIYGGITFGSKGSPMVRALQKKVGSAVDGKLGPNTVRALQKYLGTPQDGVISRPVSTVVKAMQKRLNRGDF